MKSEVWNMKNSVWKMKGWKRNRNESIGNSGEERVKSWKYIELKLD